VILLVVQPAEAGKKRKNKRRAKSTMSTSASHTTGNEAKNGYRYTLNPQGKKPVDISRVNDILLKQGDFWVEDGNACNRDGAIFHLPANPCEDGDTTDGVCSSDDPTFQEYEIFLRLVGPKGGIQVTTCATDPAEEGACVEGLCADDSACAVDSDCDVIVCSSDDLVEVRTKGKKFEDVTRDLLTLLLDTDGDNIVDTRIELFNPALEDFFWNWNTNGKPHAQLFFIPRPD
jgi:hypothetical protein